MRRILLLAAGGALLLLGGVGALIPVLPTTPFVLAGAGCFGAASPRLYHRLSRMRYFGEFIRNYKEKTGISRRTRIVGLCWLWGMLLVSMLASRRPVVCLLLAAVGAAVSVHILTIRRMNRKRRPQALHEARAPEDENDRREEQPKKEKTP